MRTLSIYHFSKLGAYILYKNTKNLSLSLRLTFLRELSPISVTTTNHVHGVQIDLFSEPSEFFSTTKRPTDLRDEETVRRVRKCLRSER